MSSENTATEEKWRPFVPTIDGQNPWPGLAPYPVWAAPFFHGREEEIQELLRLVRREDLAVVHGKSGVGKTSLLRAGFIPLLEAEDCMPVVIRLDHSPEAPALVDQVKFAITQAMILLHVDGPAADDEKTLWEYFHRRGGQFWGPRNRLLTPVLIFNKFEELFSLGCATDETRQRTNEFLPHLIDLIDNRQPLEIRRQLLDGTTESAQWNFEESGCKVVLCLRKEFVTDLDWLALRALSDEKRLALGMLRGDLAVDSVARAGAAVLDRQTAESIVRFCADSSTAVDVAPPTTPAPGAGPVAAPQSIVGTPAKAPIPAPPSAPAPATGAPIPKPASRRTPPAAAPAPKAAPDSGDANVVGTAPSSTVAIAEPPPTTTERNLSKLEVEPALLNLVCRELNAERQRLGQSHIDASQLSGAPADFLKAYYERSISDVPPQVRALVEDRLLTKFGYRRAIILEDALAIEGVGAEAIHSLVERQLLRVDDRLGTTRLELSHDVLIEPVRQSRDARLAAEEAALLERIRREFAKRMRRDRVVAAAGIVVCAIAILWLASLVVKGWHQRDQQERRAALAEKQLLASNAEKEVAQKAQHEADAARAVAENARGASEVKLTAAQAEKLAADEREAKAKVDRDAALAAKAEIEAADKVLRERVALDASRVALKEAEGLGREGDLLQQSGKADQAIAVFVDELNGLYKLPPAAFGSAQVQGMVADVNEKLATLAIARKDVAGAQKFLETAQTSLGFLIMANPNDLTLRRRSMEIYRSLGELLQKSNSLATRRKILDDGLDATKKILKAAPSDPEALRNDCYFSNELGVMDLTTAQGEPSARTHFIEAANSWAALLALNPNEPQAKNNLLRFCKYLGDVKWYGLGLGLVEKPDAAAENDPQPWNDPAEFMHGVGVARLKLNQLPVARDYLIQEESFRLAHPKPNNEQKLWATYGDLATICMTLPDYAAARIYLEKRLAVAAKPATGDQLAELPKLYAALGKACQMTGDPEAAKKAFLAGLKLEAGNVALKRGLADLYSQLAESKLRARQNSDGRTLLEDAATLYGELNAANPRDPELRRRTLDVYQQLANMALQRGEADMSRLIYERYTAIAKAAVDAAPDASDADLIEDLLTGYEGLADAYIELKNPDMTKTYFDKYETLIKSRFNGDKSSAPARHALAVAYGKLGAFREKLDPTDARHYFVDEISTLDALPAKEKDSLEFQCDLSQGLGKLASICMRLKDKAEAVATYKRAVEVDENLSKAHPDNQDLRRFAVASNTGLGEATFRLTGADPAKAFYLRGLELAQIVLKADGSIDSKLALAQSFRQCGSISLELKDSTAAATYYQSALSIDDPLFTSAPENSEAQLGLAQDLFGVGMAAHSNGDDKTAAASFTKARNLVTPLRAVKSAGGRSADELSKSIDLWLKVAGG